MPIFRDFILWLALAMLLVACTPIPGEEKAKVHCPACNTDFDALYHKRF